MSSLLEAARQCVASAAPEAALEKAHAATAQAHADGNLRLAAEAASVASSAHLALGHGVEAEKLLSEELAKCQAANDKAAQARLLWAKAGMKLALGDGKEVLRLAQEGQDLLRRRSDEDKLQAQLHLMKANAHLAANLPGTQGLGAHAAALQSASEASVLSRRSDDEVGLGEALHVACLIYLLNGLEAAKQIAQEARKEEQPWSSLKASHEAAALLRKLRNQEGEATALLFVAEARLKEGNSLEAEGAGRRALGIFRELRHRRGRQASLTLLSKANLNTFALFELVEEELASLRTQGDVMGQVAALRMLADSYISAKMYGEALSASRKSLQVLKDTDLKETQVRTLLLISQIEELLGREQAALQSAQKAMAAASVDRGLVAEARRAVSRLLARCGKPNEAPNRREALDALNELSAKARKRDAKGFKEVMARLEEISGYTEQDVKQALSGDEDPDRQELVRFLRQNQVQEGSKTQNDGSMVFTGLSHAILYLQFRVTGLAYGPRFRRCYAYGTQDQAGQAYAAAYLRLLSSQEEWGKRMCTQPTLLDSMQHSLNALNAVV